MAVVCLACLFRGLISLCGCVVVLPLRCGFGDCDLV